MKKRWLVLGVGVAFVLGSRAGGEPYERLQSKARQRAGRSDVKQTVNTVSGKVHDVADSVAGIVDEKVTDVIPKAKAPPKSEAVIDNELEKTFPSSDPPSSWAGRDKEPIGEDQVEKPKKSSNPSKPSKTQS